MNCSGKHAGMLATCVLNGWDTATYREPDHPLQVAIRETFEELTGEPVVAVATDGCGAPLLSCSLTGLARAFRTLALAQEGPEWRVAEAIRRHPEWVSGTARDERTLLTAVPGAIGKAGAGAAGADGGGVAAGRGGCRAGGGRGRGAAYWSGGAAGWWGAGGGGAGCLLGCRASRLGPWGPSRLNQRAWLAPQPPVCEITRKGMRALVSNDY